MAEQIRVLLVDDHAIVRDGLAAYLGTEDDMEVIGQAGSGAEGVKLATQLLPDVVLMDLIMPALEGIDTLEAIRRIRQQTPKTQVIILTSHTDDDYLLPAIKAGALSYLLKDVGADELADALRRAAQGEATIHPRVAARLVDEVQRGPKPSPVADLTEREVEVLRLIAQGKSNREIAETLIIGEKTVKTHVSNILSKLHLQDRTQVAIFALKQRIVPLDAE
jgi:NarL family two-component system response regulator LiaR